MIQIIEGPSGSGKSYLVYEEMIRASIKAPEQRFFLIVPEQFTMQAQRDIINLHPQHGTMNIDIVSFNRLAYRVFEELNIRCDHVLEDFGKSMLLQRILMEHRKEWQVFGSCLNKAGFLDELKSLLTELFQYRIGRDAIAQVYEGMSGHGMLKSKLHDLLFVYDAFQKELQGKYIIAEHILEMLARYIPESELLRGSVVYLDGYTGFTPIQYEVLHALLQTASAITVTITIDEAGAKQENCEEHELFYLSKDTIHRLYQLAEHLDIYVEERFLNGACPRFRGAEELQHLERNLFRYPYRSWNAPITRIRVMAMHTPGQELRKVARQIHAMVRNGEYRYQDIAVIHGNLEQVQPFAEEIFPRLGIPYFIDTKQSIYMNPCLESIRAVLDIAESDYSYESVFRLLKTGVTGMDTESLELLENYVISRGIRGIQWWKRIFSQEAMAGLQEGDQRIPVFQGGMQVIAQLEPVTTALRKSSQVQEYVQALRNFVEALEMQGQLEQAVLSFEEEGNLLQARSYGQIYDKVLDIWEKLESILGTEEMKLRDFKSILETGFEEIALGVIPPSLDQVMIGDIERTRLNHVKVLFVLGVNDGIIPRVAKGGGILSEADRSILGETLELAPDSRRRVFTEQFYLYQNVTKASQCLYLTYHVQDGDGNEVLPAYLIGRLRKLFPALTIEDLSSEEWCENDLETPADSVDYLSALLYKQEPVSEQKADIWKSLYAYYQEVQPQVITQIRKGLFYSNLDHYLTPETADRLYGKLLHTSVSKLETYSRCPYQFFLEYGLGLKERERNQITLGDMGNLLHQVVEQVFSMVENRQAKNLLLSEEVENVWETITDEELAELVEKEIQKSAEEEDSVYQYSHANRQLLKRIQRTAIYAVADLKQQLLKGKMIPYQFEMTFNRRDAEPLSRNLQAAEIPLTDTAIMKLSGVIDRIDICQDEERVYVKVLDYKSSGKEIDVTQVDAGLQLQLLIYTNVVLEVLKKQFPDKEIIPAGSLYYSFRLPMVEKSGKTVTDALSRRIKRETALTGIVNREEPCISLLGDTELLPVKVKELNGEPVIQESDTVVDEEQYRQLLTEVRETAALIGTEMIAGKIPVRPVRTGRSLPCDYCGYKDVCKLDCTDGGNRVYTAGQLRQMQKGEDRNELDTSTAEDH